MVIFSIICLVVIIIGIQHLLNWVIRITNKNEGLTGLTIFAFIFGLIGTYICIYNIIIWGSTLIK